MNPYAVRYGLGRAWGFTALSFGLWLVFWFHRTRRLLDGELSRGRDDVLVHCIGLVVPVWNIFVLYWLYRDGLAVEAPVTRGETAVLAAGAVLGLLWVGWIAALLFFGLA